MAPTLRLKKPKYAATTTTIAPIIAIFRNLCSRIPMINPMTNGMIINTIGGNPPILPEVIKLNVSSRMPIIVYSSQVSVR